MNNYVKPISVADVDVAEGTTKNIYIQKGNE